MSNNNKASDRTTGKILDRVDEDEATVTASRQAKTFKPEFDNDLSQVPQSITADAPDNINYRGLSLEALPIKGLKSFAIGLVSTFAVMLGWETYDVFQSALAVHWILAAGFAGLLIFVGLLALRCLLSFLGDKENIVALQDIQDTAEQLKSTNDMGKAKPFITQLQQFYQDKPQAVLLADSLKNMPDYSNDKEAIQHLEQVFLAPLDQEAMRRVSNYSFQTAGIIAASPWASLDMLLALWRSMKMIDEVGQVYGMRPSLANRYKLLKSVLRYIALIGASELAIDEMLQEFGTASLGGITGVRLSQGVGAGIYTARIGLAAITACRPVNFSSGNKPKLKDFITRLLQRING